jgi:hypothetical protein
VPTAKIYIYIYIYFLNNHANIGWLGETPMNLTYGWRRNAQALAAFQVAPTEPTDLSGSDLFLVCFFVFL